MFSNLSKSGLDNYVVKRSGLNNYVVKRSERPLLEEVA